MNRFGSTQTNKAQLKDWYGTSVTEEALKRRRKKRMKKRGVPVDQMPKDNFGN